MGLVRAFREVYEKVGLMDLGMVRGQFTWCNMR